MSFNISIYSIRSDTQCIPGYFPMYNSDFFDKNPERYYRSNFSHVLDYDILRMARPIVEDNPNIGSLEFGILAATEYAKERLNTLERKKRRFDDTTTNPDNDGTNDRLKMIRNNATVRGYCYINFYFDDQRNQSLDADAREISNIVSIKERGDDRYAIPWLIGGIYFDFVSPFFEKLYFNIRHCRSDEFLFAYLLQKINAVLYRYFVRERNYYGYFKLRVNLEAGTLDGAASEFKYYISRKKTYNRYISDVFRDYFRVQTADCSVGINDIPCYESVVASVDELKEQHSYFVDRMTKK